MHVNIYSDPTDVEVDNPKVSTTNNLIHNVDTTTPLSVDNFVSYCYILISRLNDNQCLLRRCRNQMVDSTEGLGTAIFLRTKHLSCIGLSH